MNIAIATLYTENIAHYGKVTTKNKEEYCSLQGYALEVGLEKLDTRPPAWSKILFVKQVLSKYDWVLWTDADALILNKSRRIEEIIDENYNFIIGRETRDTCPLNSGAFLIKNCQWSFDFLDRVYSKTHLINHPWWENMAIIEAHSESSENILVVTQRVLNAFLQDYEKEDFILHFVGNDKFVLEQYILHGNHPSIKVKC